MKAHRHIDDARAPDDDDDDEDLPSWPLRDWGLACLGGVIGFGISQPCRDVVWPLIGVREFDWVVGLLFGGLTFALVLTRSRPWIDALIAILAAMLAVRSITLPMIEGGNPYDSVPFFLATVAIFVALPLYQSWRAGRAAAARPSLFPFAPPQPGWSRIGYAYAHRFAWINALSLGLALAMSLVSLLLALLVGQLFALIGLNVVNVLVRSETFILILAGIVGGSTLGRLHGWQGTISTLQRVIAQLFTLLVPVLGLVLALFLLAIPFTGLESFWAATDWPTPLLMIGTAVALTFATSALGELPGDEQRTPLVRWGLIVLLLVVLPLAVLAAVSLNVRVSEHGLTQARIWAGIFVLFGLLYGLSYALVLARAVLVRANQHTKQGKPAPDGHRSAAPYPEKGWGWGQGIRHVNLFAACLMVVLFAALGAGLIDANAWAVRDQVARLESGKVSADTFDWATLRFDMGAAGDQAARRLALSGSTPAIRSQARKALASTNEREFSQTIEEARRPRIKVEALTVFPAGQRLPPDLLKAIDQPWQCQESNSQRCLVMMDTGQRTAILIQFPKGCRTCDITTKVYGLKDEKTWTERELFPNDQWLSKIDIAQMTAEKTQIRMIAARQVFVDGKPVGAPFK